MAKNALLVLFITCLGLALARVVPAGLSAQQASSGSTACLGAGPPDRYGEDDWVGNNAKFDYWSDAETNSGITKFQHLVRNKGKTPLSFDWKGADFGREGLAAGLDERSNCRQDASPPNVNVGLIMYGPNIQFPGPKNARFYTYQPRSSISATPGNFFVRWNAELEGGRYEVNFRFETGVFLSDRLLQYTITNNGRPVLVEWPIVLTGAVLKAAVAQNLGLELNNERLRLNAGGVIKVQIRSVVQVEPLVGPLTVYTEAGGLLYKDVFQGSVPRAQ